MSFPACPFSSTFTAPLLLSLFPFLPRLFPFPPPLLHSFSLPHPSLFPFPSPSQSCVPPPVRIHPHFSSFSFLFSPHNRHRQRSNTLLRSYIPLTSSTASSNPRLLPGDSLHIQESFVACSYETSRPSASQVLRHPSSAPRPPNLTIVIFTVLLPRFRRSSYGSFFLCCA